MNCTTGEVHRICYWRMRYIELNFGGLQISVLSWMYNLSVFFFERVLILTLMSCITKILLEKGIYFFWFA